MDTEAQTAVLDGLNLFKYATTQELISIVGIAVFGLITIAVSLKLIRWFFSLFDSSSTSYSDIKSSVTQPDFQAFSTAFDQKDDKEWGIPRNTDPVPDRHIDTTTIEGLDEKDPGYGHNLGGDPNWQLRDKS